MPTTYTGVTGRLVGICWGLFWLGIGAGLYLGVGLSAIEGIEGLPFVAFVVFGLLYGPYSIVKALVTSDYEITFRRGRGG